MRRFRGQSLLFVLFFLSCAVLESLAAAQDQKLLSLVPVGAHLVAGLNVPPSAKARSSFLLTTHNNSLDMRDFLALAGVDTSLGVREMIFVAIDSKGTGILDEHSILVSGHFDQARIYKSALENGAVLTSYRRVHVLSLQPFARERGEMNDVRWFAILDSNLLLFGTLSSVQQELDRHLAHSDPDPALASRLARMRRDDGTWCIVSGPARTPEIRNAFTLLDDGLAERVNAANTLQFGIRYGKQVEFEYEITVSSTAVPAVLAPQAQLASLLLPSSATTEHGMIRISMAQYNAWTTQVYARGNGLRLP